MSNEPPLMGTEHYIYRRDGNIRVYRVGGGEPVLFIHGSRNSGWTWRGVIGELSRHFACYVVDLPGFDRSDIPPRKYSMDDFAEAMVEVMDAAGLEQTHIIGEHTGAVVGVLLAAKYPERVKKLVLDGLLFWNSDQGKVIWEKFFLPDFTDTTAYHLPVVSLVSWEEAKATGQGNVAGRSIEEARESDREVWEKQEEIHRRSRLWERYSYESITQCDIVAAGARVKAPTLLLCGDRDVARHSAEKARAGIKGSVLTWVKDCPGYVHAQQPDQLVKEALAFFKA